MQGDGSEMKRPTESNGMTGLTSHKVRRRPTAGASLCAPRGAERDPLLSAVTRVLPRVSQLHEGLAQVSRASPDG